MKLLKKKEDDEFMVVSKKKPQPGKKGAAAPQPEAAAASSSSKTDSSKKKLQHTLETLKTFMQFGIDVPQVAGELTGVFLRVCARESGRVGLSAWLRGCACAFLIWRW